jgi:hypothetical protein
MGSPVNLQHLNVKLYLESPETLDLEPFILIFNRWIQERATEDLLVDVADYRHVFDGPGIVLIGHEANYSIDNLDGRWGLLYNRKAQVSGSTQARIRQAVRAALAAALKLEREQGLKFGGQEVQLVVNDRLLAPNTPETWAALEPELKAFFDPLDPGAGYTFVRPDDPRERITVNVRASAPFDLEKLSASLREPASETTHA